ncbi:hypothetical protein GA0061105_11348 [Rhizobium aethiopicum]|uniref:Uncharacterized protein n=1 Tax=Rhizobium aethiopicum TaxID=1138170 RepID=A0A1C3Y8S5_9HYPH|nr:hypothetical protein GA0061105_11348 [Rhizobium aethiopicum]
MCGGASVKHPADASAAPGPRSHETGHVNPVGFRRVTRYACRIPPAFG